jgi:hypothetical protein
MFSLGGAILCSTPDILPAARQPPARTVSNRFQSEWAHSGVALYHRRLFLQRVLRRRCGGGVFSISPESVMTVTRWAFRIMRQIGRPSIFPPALARPPEQPGPQSRAKHQMTRERARLNANRDDDQQTQRRDPPRYHCDMCSYGTYQVKRRKGLQLCPDCANEHDDINQMPAEINVSPPANAAWIQRIELRRRKGLPPGALPGHFRRRRNVAR